MSNVIDPSRQSWNKAEEERLRSALQAIPADHDLDSQIKVGFALNSLKSDDRWPRRALWDEWTAAIHAEPTEKEIDSFVQDYRGPPITVEVIYHLAKKWGWADPWASLNNIKARPAYLDSPGAASPSFAPSPTNGRPPVMLSALTPPQLTLADPFGPVAMTSPPLIDLEQARNFLAALAPGETEFTFQTFDDNKKRRREKL